DGVLLSAAYGGRFVKRGVRRRSLPMSRWWGQRWVVDLLWAAKEREEEKWERRSVAALPRAPQASDSTVARRRGRRCRGQQRAPTPPQRKQIPCRRLPLSSRRHRSQKAS